MEMSNYFKKELEIEKKYKIPFQQIQNVIEFYDFKRIVRGNESDLELCIDVLTRHLRIKNNIPKK